MKKLLLLLMLAPITCWAQSEDDFGVWSEVGVSKSLPHNFSIGGSAEVRTEDNSTKLDRWSVGVDAGYKVHKYLKLGIGYSFLHGYTAEKQGKEKYNTVTGELQKYRITPAYFRPRHRFTFEATTGIKLWKCIRISLRERYQYTYHAEQTIDRTDYKLNPVTDEWYTEAAKPKIDEQEHSHILRSRLKIELDKKRCHWSPYASLETHNELDNSLLLRKIRFATGTEYKINKHHAVNLSYILTREREEGITGRMHAVSVGYNIDL